MQPGSAGSSRRQCCRPCGPGAPRSLPGSHLAPAAEPGEPRQPRPSAPCPPAGARPARDCTAQEWRPPRPGAAPEPLGTGCPRRGPTCGERRAEAGSGGPGVSGAGAGGRSHSDTARAPLQPLRPLGPTSGRLVLCLLRLLLVPGYSPRHCHGGASTRARRLPLGKLISLPLLPFANLPKDPAKSQKRLGNERRRLKS